MPSSNLSASPLDALTAGLLALAVAHAGRQPPRSAQLSVIRRQAIVVASGEVLTSKHQTTNLRVGRSNRSGRANRSCAIMSPIDAQMPHQAADGHTRNFLPVALDPFQARRSRTDWVPIRAGRRLAIDLRQASRPHREDELVVHTNKRLRELPTFRFSFINENAVRLRIPPIEMPCTISSA